MRKTAVEREIREDQGEGASKDDNSTILHDVEQGDEVDMETIDRVYRYVLDG